MRPYGPYADGFSAIGPTISRPQRAIVDVMDTYTYSVAGSTRAAALAAIDTAARRFAALLRETDDARRPVEGTDWTVGETAAHVSVVFIGYSAAIRREPFGLALEQYAESDFPTRLAAVNTATLAMVDHSDAIALAGFVEHGVDRFLTLAAESDGDRQCETPWYGAGCTRSVDCLIALALGELTVHGHDIATSAGRSWEIPSADAKLLLGTVCPEMLPLVVRPGVCRDAPATYEIRVRNGGPRYVVSVADEAAQVNAAGGPVDCVLSADALTLLLVMYGRLPMSTALLSGGIVATGRTPWLGAQFKNLFFNP